MPFSMSISAIEANGRCSCRAISQICFLVAGFKVIEATALRSDCLSFFRAITRQKVILYEMYVNR